jgi:hypothetical protein
MNRISLLLAALLVLPPAEAGILPANALAPGFPEDLLSLPYGSAATRFNLKGQPGFGLEQARRGEGRGGGGRRGERGGGRVQRANTGMNRAPRSFDRGNRKPSGGWSRDTVKRRDRDRPSLDRTSFDRSNFGNREHFDDPHQFNYRNCYGKFAALWIGGSIHSQLTKTGGTNPHPNASCIFHFHISALHAFAVAGNLSTEHTSRTGANNALIGVVGFIWCLYYVILLGMSIRNSRPPRK